MRALLESTKTPFTACTYPADATIFMQGDAAEHVIYLEEGTVRLAVASESGKEAICGVLTSGTFIGEGALRHEDARRHTAFAMTPVVALEIATADMLQLLRVDGPLFTQFIGHLLTRHMHLEADLTDQIISSSEQRVARALLRLAGCGIAPARNVLPQISQELIAQMVGTTRSRVNAFMGKFKRLGLIEASGGQVQVNPSLRRVARGGGIARVARVLCTSEQNDEASTA
ncbi:MAG: Crp/Fnr family transcriptional regulator [Acidobacteria bacterium]|nr:Crp/Fnr family transcriptional regulator [Acidobacteriota bacterium]